MTFAEALTLIAESEFRPFDQGDWYSFSGAMSKNPLICYREDCYIIIDDDIVEIGLNNDSEELTNEGVYHFRLGDF